MTLVAIVMLMHVEFLDGKRLPRAADADDDYSDADACGVFRL